MTAQIADSIIIEGNEFSITGVNGNGLFDPESIGVKPVPSMSACWRGYVCSYLVRQDRLVLESLSLSLYSDEMVEGKRALIPLQGPTINGVSPDTSRQEAWAFSNVYTGLDLHVPFTGGILAASGFIRELYVHMGFHPAWKFRSVYELLLVEGAVLELHNVSEQIEEMRARMINRSLRPNIQTSSKREIEDWIERTFRLDYNLGE